MKATAVVVIILALLGCGEVTRKYEWVVERQGKSPDQIQNNYNALAKRGWVVYEDDDLQRSGFYVTFTKYMLPSELSVESIKLAEEIR